MNAFVAMELMSKYSICPNCGSRFVGNGEGTLLIDDTFKRSCKCGWHVEINESYENVEG